MKSGVVKDHWRVTISGGSNWLGIDKGKFEGDCEAAIAQIKEFCDSNTVSIESHGWGYSTLQINQQKHDITPYGIDIEMMLKFCDLQLDSEAKADAKKTNKI